MCFNSYIQLIVAYSSNCMQKISYPHNFCDLQFQEQDYMSMVSFCVFWSAPKRVPKSTYCEFLQHKIFVSVQIVILQIKKINIIYILLKIQSKFYRPEEYQIIIYSFCECILSQLNKPSATMCWVKHTHTQNPLEKDYC